MLRAFLFLPLLVPGLLCAEDVTFRNASPASSLIELYSSEGCSSCPPAEAWVSGLKAEPGLWKELFPVVFHVDYWDDLGWPDHFARSEFTRRQYAEASRLSQDSVYTPEFVVNGREWRASWRRSLPEEGRGKTGELTLTVRVPGAGGAPVASVLYAGGGAGEGLMVHVALLAASSVTDVKRGENGGKRLLHDFAVLRLLSAPLKADAAGLGSGDLAFSALTEAPGAAVAWVTRPDGTVLQAAGGWLPTPGAASVPATK